VKEEFTCDVCGGTFQELWPDEAAAAEREANFGEPPRADDGLVCDDCYKLIMGRKSR
jgi:hypothetical protein